MKYDVVIVGGGAAGSVLAGRLAANTHISVLLLEAGPDYPDPANLPDEIKFGHTRFAEAPDSQHNWALRGTITAEQGEIHVAQGKVIGGGSSINGQALQRGFPQDFNSWRLSATTNGRMIRSCRIFANRSAISTFRTIIATARTDRFRSGAVRRAPGLPSNRLSMPPVCRRGDPIPPPPTLRLRERGPRPPTTVARRAQRDRTTYERATGALQ
jgi:GMC oxidoreductase